MKTLPISLHRNGFRYLQICRGQKACIYAQKISGTRSAYEVFIIKIRPERRVNGKVIEAREVFPNNEAFGYSAWTYRNLKDAIARYVEIEKSKR